MDTSPEANKLIETESTAVPDTDNVLPEISLSEVPDPLLDLLTSIDSINAPTIYVFFKGIIFIKLINIFILTYLQNIITEKGVTEDLVPTITEDELKYIVPIENNLILYLKFKKNFINWKMNNIALPKKNTYTETIESNVSQFKNGPENNRNDTLVNLHNLVEHIVKTKYADIEKKMNNSKKNLNSAEIRQLLEYIINYYQIHHLYMDLKSMEKIAKQIAKIFPNENKV